MYSFHIGSCGEKWLPLYLNQKLSLSICLGFPLCQFSFASLVHWLKGFPTCSSSLWYYSLSFFKCSIHLHISKIYNINFISVPFVYFEVFWQESLTILLTITSKEKTGGLSGSNDLGWVYFSCWFIIYQPVSSYLLVTLNLTFII